MGKVEFEDYKPPHLSYSTVNSYRMCPKQMYFSKIAKLEQLPGLAAIGGNAVHSLTEALDREHFSQHGK